MLPVPPGLVVSQLRSRPDLPAVDSQYVLKCTLRSLEVLNHRSQLCTIPAAVEFGTALSLPENKTPKLSKALEARGSVTACNLQSYSGIHPGT
jgi:hypothetical protein